MPKTQEAKQGYTPEWYEANTGNHQGLVCEKETGRNIAVVYDKKDAPLIAAAPTLLEACYEILELETTRLSARAKADLRAAIALAEGKE